MTASSAHRTVEAVWRMQSAKIIGGLTRVLRDVGLAEELAQDAMVAALEQWPRAGIPDNPGAWLMAAAKHRAIDVIRRKALHRRKEEELTREIETQLQDAMPSVAALVEAAFDDPIGDDVLRHVRCLPPSAWARRSRCIDLAHCRGSHDRRDRTRLPGAGSDNGTADRACEARAQ